jgi:NAD(P)-dependent dehydrogenase (short-subunit alcohol dehydrogenase family)
MELDLETGPDEGLHQVILRADRKALDAGEAVAVIRVSSEAAEAGQAVEAEAVFGQQGARRVIAQLDLRGRFEKDVDEVESVARDALGEFGGVDLTSVSLGRIREPGRAELVDLTIAFAASVPLFATNTALLGDVESDQDAALCAKLLDALGVRYRRDGRAIRVSRRQIRSRPTLAAQLEALKVMNEAGSATIYTAPIPALHSLSLSLLRNDRKVAIDLWLSRGLSRRDAVTSDGCKAMQTLIERHSGALFSGRRWRVELLLEEPPAPRRGAGVFPERKPMQWSLNWGARR